MEREPDKNEVWNEEVGSKNSRWRDDPQNAALAQKCVNVGAFDAKTVEEVMDYHEGIGSDPGPVLRYAIYSHGLGGKPYLDTTGTKTELDPFEQDIVDRLIGGELHTEKLV
jgi:hypothetical protein